MDDEVNGILNFVIMKNLFLKVLILFVLAIGMISLNDDETHASNFQPFQTTSRTTLIYIPGLSFEELEQDMMRHLPHLSRMIHEGAIGAMNVRQIGEPKKLRYAISEMFI